MWKKYRVWYFNTYHNKNSIAKQKQTTYITIRQHDRFAERISPNTNVTETKWPEAETQKRRRTATFAKPTTIQHHNRFPERISPNTNVTETKRPETETETETEPTPIHNTQNPPSDRRMFTWRAVDQRPPLADPRLLQQATSEAPRSPRTPESTDDRRRDRLERRGRISRYALIDRGVGARRLSRKRGAHARRAPPDRNRTRTRGKPMKRCCVCVCVFSRMGCVCVCVMGFRTKRRRFLSNEEWRRRKTESGLSYGALCDFFFVWKFSCLAWEVLWKVTRSILIWVLNFFNK